MTDDEAIQRLRELPPAIVDERMAALTQGLAKSRGETAAECYGLALFAVACNPGLLLEDGDG